MKKVISVSISFIVLVLLYLLWWNSSLLQQLDYKILDRLNQIFPSDQRPNSTVVVEIDDKSIEAFGQWPWPRVMTSELVHAIADGDPASISLDMVFSEKDRTSPESIEQFYRDGLERKITLLGVPDSFKDNDRILAQTLGETTAFLAVFSNTNAQGKECLFPPSANRYNELSKEYLLGLESLVCSLPLYHRHVKGIGHIHALADSDGTLRRLNMFIAHRDETIPTLGIVGTSLHDEVVQEKSTSTLRSDREYIFADRSVFTDINSSVLLTFYPYEEYVKLSAYDVLTHRFNPNVLKDKSVFIGTTALGLDTWHTLHDGSVIPGVFVHATSAENFKNGDFKVQPSLYPKLNMMLSFGIALVLLQFLWRKRYLTILYLFFGSVSVELTMTMVGWNSGIYLSTGYFLIPLLSFVFMVSLLMFFIDYQQKKRFMDEIIQSNRQKEHLRSELDRSESEIEYQKAMLFQQSKLAAMGEMIDNIAHQWRQPLNILGMIVQDIEYAYKSGKMDRGYAQKTVLESMEQIEFMSQTIDDFRNFVKPNQTNAPFELNQSIREALQLLGGMLETNRIETTVQYTDKEINIYGLSSEFKQVIINLLNNAKDALIENCIANPWIRIRIESDEHYTRINVSDNGGGIALEVIDRIFEPYFTTKEEGKGSGIGLYMSYAIIRTKMGGTIDVKNMDGGSLFTIALPLYKFEKEDEF